MSSLYGERIDRQNNQVRDITQHIQIIKNEGE